MSFLRTIFLMLIGLISLPFLLLRFGPGMFRAMSSNPFGDMDGPKADAHVRLTAGKPVVRDGVAIFDAASRAAEEGHWADLSDMLHEAVDQRLMTSPEKRDYEHITAGARSGLTRVLNTASPEQCRDAIANHLSRFDAAADAAQRDPALAAIAARAHLDVGWAFRGDGYAESVTEEDWAEMSGHYETAAKRIAPFLASKPVFPPIAHAAHIIARQQDGDAALKRAYDRWCAADPGNPTIYAEHAFHLLPRWGGSHTELAATAQRAATIDPEGLGAAPALWLYLGVLECEPEALAAVDPDLFRDAVRDHLYLDGTSRGANSLLRELSTLWLSIPIDPGQDNAFASIRALCRDACRVIVEDHLCEVDLSIWDNGATEARQVIGLLYKDEIEEGFLLEFESGALELRKAA